MFYLSCKYPPFSSILWEKINQNFNNETERHFILAGNLTRFLKFLKEKIIFPIYFI